MNVLSVTHHYLGEKEMTQFFTADKLQRDNEEVKALCEEMRESKEHKSRQFESLSYEDGVLATVRWLFFKTAESPYDVKRDEISARISNTQLNLFREELEQIQENRE